MNNDPSAYTPRTSSSTTVINLLYALYQNPVAFLTMFMSLVTGKMAKDGVVQFSGCNTSSIGGSTINPLVGLSMAARRLLYFSLPYFQDRADGVPAAEASKQWEKTWNADLARDTSVGLKGTIVCGYRTFGLVPGRLPGVTKLLGNQEATTPGYVAGKKGCYKDGNEVPAP